MPPDDKRLCHCTQCKGNPPPLRPRTIRQHMRDFPPTQPVFPSFTEWQASQSQGAAPSDGTGGSTTHEAASCLSQAAGEPPAQGHGPEFSAPGSPQNAFEPDSAGGARESDPEDMFLDPPPDTVARPASAMSVDGSSHSNNPGSGTGIKSTENVGPTGRSSGTPSSPVSQGNKSPQLQGEGAAAQLPPVCEDGSSVPLRQNRPEDREDPNAGRPPSPVNPRLSISQNVDMQNDLANLPPPQTLLPPPFETEDGEEIITPTTSRIEDLQTALDFMHALRAATMENSDLAPDILEQLHNPEAGLPELSGDYEFFIELYFATFHAPESIYTGVRACLLRKFGDSMEVPSLYKIRRYVEVITGIVAVHDDMCVDSCAAFTGPFSTLDKCPVCDKDRYHPSAPDEKRHPRKQMTTILLGPQLQAVRRSPQGAESLRYRQTKVAEIQQRRRNLQDPLDDVYDDVFCGSDYLHLHEQQHLTEDDVCVAYSLDGAQLYQNVKSDTWIGIWIVYDYAPGVRYKRKNVLPAFVIPGPGKPKNLDSFNYRSLQHLAAIQRANGGRGLQCWDGAKEEMVFSRTILILNTADAVALVEMDGRVGHHGAQGCRIGCPMKGRRKPGSGGHYYCPLLLPNHYHVEGCNHPDVDPRQIAPIPPIDFYNNNITQLLTSTSQTEYETNRRDTGLCKPSILSGLERRCMLPVPRCFGLDLMHLFFLNIGELLVPLWRGNLACGSDDNKATWTWAVLTGDVWKDHGKLVGDSRRYFPSSFHRPPRNPAEKINSKYKATEYYLYLFGLGPGVFRAVLPFEYWTNFCKLAAAVRTYIQHSITVRQLRNAESLTIQFVEEFERLYYQRKINRMHFCRPSLHTIIHIARETTRIGPGAYYTQFTMERAIGYLGKEIRQPGNPFANLCQIAIRASQMNALKTLFPHLDPPPSLPQGSYDAGNGYIFLAPRTRFETALDGDAAAAIQTHYNSLKRYRKWGRLRLPNGQVARSCFAEERRSQREPRVTRNVKMMIEGKTEFGEVQFYFIHSDQRPTGNVNEAIISQYKAVVSFYSPPNPTLLRDSSHTLWACSLPGNSYRVVDVSSIISVVSMQPLPKVEGDADNLWFVVEKSGLDDMDLSGDPEPLDNDEGDILD